jgi:hypothetical protein
MIGFVSLLVSNVSIFCLYFSAHCNILPVCTPVSWKRKCVMTLLIINISPFALVPAGVWSFARCGSLLTGSTICNGIGSLYLFVKLFCCTFQNCMANMQLMVLQFAVWEMKGSARRWYERIEREERSVREMLCYLFLTTCDVCNPVSFDEMENWES